MFKFPDWFNDVTVGSVIVACGGVLVIVLGVVFIIKYVHPIVKRIVQFLDDWHGRPARPGYDEVPGFPDRLKRVEARLDEISLQITSTTKDKT